MLHDPWRGLVQYQPVEPELLDSPDELLEIYRLAYVAVGAEAVAVEHVPLLSRRSQDDHGQAPRTLICPQALEYLEPVHPGQLEIEQYQLRHDGGIPSRIGAACEQIIEGLDPIVGHHDLVPEAGLLERPQGEQLIVGVVLDQENNLGAHLAPSTSLKGLRVLVLFSTLEFRHCISLCSQASLGGQRLRLHAAALLSSPRCTGNGTLRPGSPCRLRNNRESEVSAPEWATRST